MDKTLTKTGRVDIHSPAADAAKPTTSVSRDGEAVVDARAGRRLDKKAANLEAMLADE